MQTDIDTADIVRYQGEEYTVACAHITHIYLMGLAPYCVRRELCTLVTKASSAAAYALTKALAESTGDGHRPKCARERLAAQAYVGDADA